MRQLRAATMAAVALAVTGLAGPAQARVHDGNELWAICGETTEGDPPDPCMYYIYGVVDDASDAAGGDFFAIPEGVSQAQFVGVVRAYLSNHPEYRDRPAPAVIIQALSEAWPVQNGGGQ